VNALVPDNAIVNGFRIAHGTHGSGEPVVLIHGTPSSSYIWRNVIPGLVDAGYQVQVFDLLGYGASERPKDGDVDTSVTGQVGVLLGLLDAWSLRDAHIVAHDIGGGVAQRLSVFYPARVRSLTLIDSVSFDSWPSERTRQQMTDGLDALISANPADHRARFEGWLLSTVQNTERFRRDALAVYLDLITGSVGQASFFQHQMSRYDPVHTMEVAGRLSELARIPVQILWGADDQWQNVAWAHRLHEAIPGSTLSIIMNCGHFVMEDQPEAVTSAVLTFLKR